MFTQIIFLLGTPGTKPNTAVGGRPHTSTESRAVSRGGETSAGRRALNNTNNNNTNNNTNNLPSPINNSTSNNNNSRAASPAPGDISNSNKMSVPNVTNNKWSFQPPAGYEVEEAAAMNAPQSTIGHDEIFMSIGWLFLTSLSF